jgi:hypothetical protein
LHLADLVAQIVVDEHFPLSTSRTGKRKKERDPSKKKQDI